MVFRAFSKLINYIGKNHEFAHKDSDKHQIEYMFFCTLRTPVEMSRATCLDTEQVGFEWISFLDLPSKNIYPKVLRSAFDDKGNITTAVYLGDIN